MINERMKVGVLYAAIGILAAFGAACSNEPGQKETANSAPIIKSEPAKPASDKGDAVVTGGDLAFMNDAAPGGMAEVELGKMAAGKAQNAEVKAFGQKMVDDH